MQKIFSVFMSFIIMVSVSSSCFAYEETYVISDYTMSDSLDNVNSLSWGNWSSWSSYTVSGTTVAAMTAAIGALCPKLVSAAASYASVLIASNVHTCTMMTRIRYAYDSNYQYYEMQVKFYVNGSLFYGPETVSGKASLSSIIKRVGNETF